MVDENFVLKWKSHTDQMRQTLHEMMTTESLTDVTIVSSDQLYFKAHKVVLGAGSRIFNDIVNKMHANDSFIFMRGINGKDLKSILSFVYLGEVSVDQERMNEFLETAKDLAIRGLSKQERDTNSKNHESPIKDNNRRLEYVEDANDSMNETGKVQPTLDNAMKEEDKDEQEDEDFIISSNLNQHLTPIKNIEIQKQNSNEDFCNESISEIEQVQHDDDMEEYDGVEQEDKNRDSLEPGDEEEQITFETNDSNPKEVCGGRRTRRGNPGDFACQLCGKTFPRFDYIKRHLTLGLKENCVDGNSTAEKKAKIQANLEHNKQTMYSCEDCPILFKNTRLLRRHITTTQHKVKDSLLIFCKRCDFTTNAQYKLKGHNRFYHNKAYNYEKEKSLNASCKERKNRKTEKVLHPIYTKTTQ